jgi:hypothetical protein
MKSLVESNPVSAPINPHMILPTARISQRAEVDVDVPDTTDEPGYDPDLYYADPDADGETASTGLSTGVKVLIGLTATAGIFLFVRAMRK